MKKIEHIYEPEEMYKAIRENASEFNISKLYSNEADFKEAIAVISQKQILLQPAYISHPIVGLNVMKQIFSDFTFSENPMTMHSELMNAINDYSVALAYIEDNRQLTFVVPDQISMDLGRNIDTFAKNIASQSYSDTLLVSIGDISFEEFDTSKIGKEVEKRKTNVESFPVKEIVIITSKGRKSKSEEQSL